MPHSSKPLPRTIEIQVADPATEEVFPTSLLDGIMRKIYNPVTLTYSLDDDADLEKIISTTCAGLQTLMRDEYPFLAASVHEDPTTGHSFAKRTRGAQSRFTVHVNDLRHTLDFPSYAALAAAHFPVSALEDPRLLPPSFTPFPAAPADGSGIPVTLVQLNVIRGGLIIGLAINHRVVDARGLDAIVARWAAHTRALFNAPGVHAAPPVPPFEHAELDREPLDWAAADVAKGKSKVDWRDPAVPSMRCLPDGAPTGPGVKPEDMASRIWHVSASKLAALKARASGDEGEAWVSTNDCLTALMWRCITRARLARHGIDAVSCAKDTRPVKLMNAIDVRAYVPTTPAAGASSPSSSFDSDDSGSGSGSGTEGSDTDSDTGRCSPTSSGNGIGIPDAYPGNTVMFSHATLPLNTLLSPSSPSPSSTDPSFRTIALAIRSAISYYRHPSTLRRALSWIASCPGRGVGTIEMDFDVVLGLDVVATSWRVLRAYERADFGWSSDGGLKALRWAAPLFDGYCFFYPTRKAGAGEDEGVEVYLGLERGCMERLVADPELAGWAEVRGE
ncbi:Trichothecene 3-o-acetyltransferase [Lasiodiplodia theobromae]|uniref:Trichothecene 3-o-acetyltransferase n=1 Tax=Lasiodiplodia theobromae TaxID=45133 RepID=UPI0015C40232|nr:Trichothecene 3-o-acetyltransferase [Lasiodiplodia theobromae]KAF4539560.1 Trichothecene 3-o-acetyltransferase [Lasiodiplodia theobromae]